MKISLDLIYDHIYICRQAVITPSALSMVYPKAAIEGYSREQFLADLMSEAETDIRECFASGAHSEIQTGPLFLGLDALCQAVSFLSLPAPVVHFP